MNSVYVDCPKFCPDLICIQTRNYQILGVKRERKEVPPKKHLASCRHYFVELSAKCGSTLVVALCIYYTVEWSFDDDD